jgi:hypothetical protein
VHRGDRLCIGDEELPVELRHVEDRGHVAVVERPQPHHGIARQRLRRGDHDVRVGLAQARAGSHQRPTRPEAGDQHVDARQVAHDLGAGALVVRARVPLVRVLEEHRVPRLGSGHLLREPHRPVRALTGGGVDDLRPVQLEHEAPLGRRVRGHHTGELEPAQLRDERERDPRVPARRLEQVRARLEPGGLDHRERDPVLDRAGRVLPFELGVDRDPRRREMRKLHERRVADQVEQ